MTRVNVVKKTPKKALAAATQISANVMLNVLVATAAKTLIAVNFKQLKQPSMTCRGFDFYILTITNSRVSISRWLEEF